MASGFEALVSQEPVNSEKTGVGGFEYLAGKQEAPDEVWWKNALRTIYQIPSGIGQALTYPLDLASMIATGESLDPEEIDQIRKVSERAGIPFDEEKYLKSVQTAQETFPTQSNIERGIEERTGLPLTPKTRLQKGLKFASTAGKLAPTPSTFRGMQTALPKPVLGAGIGATKEIAQELGVPEPVAELGSFAVLKNLPNGSPSISIGTKKGPSGLPERQFESLKRKTEVSERRLGKINEKVENDFRKIADEIIQESPISNTYNALENDLTFQQKIGEKFEDVKALADQLPETFSSHELKKDIAKVYQAKEGKGISPSEYQKDYGKFMRGYLNDIKQKDLNARSLVDQFRENNRSLGEIYERGQSLAYNRAKKDALLDYNRVIADTIKTKYPDSEFSKLFEFTNKRWTEIYDSQYINKFVDDLFKDGINFEKGKKFFTPYSKEVFTRALGKENLPKFEQLTKDLMGKKEAYSLLSKAKDKGFFEFAKSGMAYLLHPNLLKGQFAVDAAKSAYKSLLDLPKVSVIWDEGIQAAKKGDFVKAQTKFAQIDEIVQTNKAKEQKALKEFNQKVRENQKRQTEIPVKVSLIEQPKNKLTHAAETMKAQENRPSVQAQRQAKEKNIQIKTSKEKEKSRFSNVKEAYDKNNNNLGGLAYDIEPTGEVYVSGIYVEEASRRKGIAKELFKNLIEEFPERDIVISPLQPDGAKFFSNIIERELKPQLTENYDKIKGSSQTPIKLTKKDITNARKNLGIKEQKSFNKNSIEKKQPERMLKSQSDQSEISNILLSFKPKKTLLTDLENLKAELKKANRDKAWTKASYIESEIADIERILKEKS